MGGLPVGDPDVDLKDNKTRSDKQPYITTLSPAIDINKVARGFMANKKTECRLVKRSVNLIKQKALVRLLGHKQLWLTTWIIRNKRGTSSIEGEKTACRLSQHTGGALKV